MQRFGWSRHLAILPALQSLARAGGVRMRVRGSSMLPLIADGAVVELVAATAILPGDIVAFLTHAGAPVVHRALGWSVCRQRLALITQGDACPRPDLGVDPRHIIGRVVRIDRIDGGVAGAVPLAARLTAVGRFLQYLGRAVARRVRSVGPVRA